MKRLFWICIAMHIVGMLYAQDSNIFNSEIYDGPYEIKSPIGSDEKNPENQEFKTINSLKLHLQAFNSEEFNRPANLKKTNPSEMDSSSNKLYYYYPSLKVNAFGEYKIQISSKDVFRLLKGNDVLLENDSFKDSIEASEKNIELITGDHQLILQVLSNSTPEFELNVTAIDSTQTISFNYNKARIDLNSLTHVAQISSVKLSSDGKLALLSLRKKSPPKGKTESWMEIMNVKSQSLKLSLRNIGNLSQAAWKPNSKIISYVITKDDISSIYWNDLNGKSGKYLSFEGKIKSYKWSNNGDFIIIESSNKGKKHSDKVRLLDGMASRLPGFESYSYLYKYELSNASLIQLTYGSKSTSLEDISNDGNKLIYSTGDYDYSREPYSNTTFWSLDLKSLISDSLFNSFNASSAIFSPDDKQLLILGGPSAFGKIGENVEEGQIANNYDYQMYLYNLEEAEVKSLTYDFNPSISQFKWKGDLIYFTCTDRDRNNLYTYNPLKNEFKLFKNGPDLSRSFDISKDAKTLMLCGSNSQNPSKLYKADLKKNELNEIYSVSDEVLNAKSFGEIKDWDFINENGDTIDGRYYLPSDFDESKSYPLLVYYYGGTVPVSRSFGGRYPYNWYASQGYVVYVLQPRGCTGYGQKFSATHVNNWGKTTASDIIEGVQKFTREHKFIIKEAIGCMGASYGGFMTMYLMTQTDIFAASVSHAGISSISSYWGEGYWGYAYSAIASSGSFPWNRKDIYVDQSPLFQADKVNTPILLTHGTSDTNVPVGESYQFYTALKLLGKEVELLEVPGQDHWILDYEKYFLWKYSIMAWFDKHLKNDDKWWDNLHGE